MARHRPLSALADTAAPARSGARGTAGRPPISRADYVHQTLRDEIALGALLPGTPLGQDEIAARLGVSITPVREALRRLEAAGFVNYEAHYGATVSSLSDEALNELYLLRSVVEGLAARLAAARITAEELDQLDQIQADMRSMVSQHDVAGLARGSRDFHSLIAEIGGPDYLAKHLQLIWENSPIPTKLSVWANENASAHSLAAHAELIQALRAGDAAAAGSLMSGHVIDVIELRLSLNRHDGSDTDLSLPG